MTPEVYGSDAALKASDFQRLKEYLIERTGLSYYADKDEQLARLVEIRLNDLRLTSCAEYLRNLQGGAGETELRQMVTRMTIGETYFFRHSEQFDALRDIVLPDLLARKSVDRELRIWCAGCASGPEVYSLAILLRRDLAVAAADCSTRIVGSDLNEESLRQAEIGVYNEWAMRNVTDEIRAECFHPREKSWEIRELYREGVSFVPHNLATDRFPAIEIPDLILCRNVMIYFHQHFIPQLVDRFHEWLAPDGWLVVGHAEAHIDYFTRFETRNAPGATLYRKSAGRSPQGVTEWLPTCVIEPPPDLDFAWLPPAPLPPAPGAPWAEVEALLRAGDWSHAGERCELLLSLDPVDPMGHLLHATVLEKKGDPAAAERALRRAIYLDRAYVGAHFRLAELSERQGEVRGAARSYATVARLLERLSADSEPVPLCSYSARTLSDVVKRKIASLEAT